MNENKEKGENYETHEEIPTEMWKTAILIASQSFLYGYCSSALNGCIITGDDNSGSDCYHGTDSSCPKGTLYNDINMTDGAYFLDFCCIRDRNS
jgi:hypothetical protein